MQVYSEARPAGGGKVIGVTLSDEDMLSTAPEFADLPLGRKWKILTDKADLFLVEWMVRRGDISKEYAAQRIAEIQQGAPS